MALLVRINGVEYEALRTFYIREQTGNKTESSFSVLVQDQPIPLAGDIIEVKDGDAALFWGVCGIPSSPKFQTGNERGVWSIVCGNANSLLANRIINEAYQNYTVTQIVNSLFTKYIAEEGVSKGTISAIPLALKIYTAADYNLQTALNELADLVGATWQITSDKVFNFIVQEDFPRFPVTIDQNFLLGTDLQHKTKDYKTRTVQYISGAKETTAAQTEIFEYDGETNTFQTSFPLTKKPSISVNGVPVPPSDIGVNGFDENRVFYFSSNSQIITYDESTEYLTAGDTVTIIYVGTFPIRISVANEVRIAQIAAATGTSGKREQVRISPDLSTTEDAFSVADQLLSQYSEATGEVSLWLLSSQLYAAGMTLDDTAVLTQITFDLPDLGIEGEFVVTERRIEPFAADMDGAADKLKVTLALKNRDFLKSYGEIISDLRDNINKLSVRDTDIVIQAASITEKESFFEDYDFRPGPVYFPTNQLLSTYSLFAPIDLGLDVYPIR